MIKFIALLVIINIILLNINVFLLAVQMWTLVRLFPLIIGREVPEEDPHWENFLTLPHGTHNITG